MLQNFQPPTDNLYKFVALTGLVFTVTGIVVPLGVFYSLRIRELEYAVQAATAKVEFEVWQGAEFRMALERQKNYEEWKRFWEEVVLADVSDEVRKAARATEDRIHAEDKSLLRASEQVTDRAATADKAIAAMKTKALEIDFLKWTAKATLWSSGVLVITGIVLAVSGFYFWYVRTQRYLDKLIAAEANAKMQSTA